MPLSSLSASVSLPNRGPADRSVIRTAPGLPEALVESWLTAPWEVAKVLQRPLPDGALQVVAVGQKQDGRP